MVKEKPEEKSAIQTEGESHKEETEKLDAKTQKVKQPKEEKPAKEEKKPTNPTFPHETMINAYGFLQFGKEVMTAIGVSKTEKSESGKAVYPITKVSITGYNAETREITIKVA